MPTVPGPRESDSIYRGKCSTRDFKTQARNISRQCIEGALTWVYPHEALAGLKKKKFITCKPAHFLHKDRLSLQRSVDISELVHL